MGEPALKYYTTEEYLAFERASETKHELYNGEIFDMAGASFNHNQIQMNFTGEVRGLIMKNSRPFVSLAVTNKFDLSKFMEFAK